MSLAPSNQDSASDLPPAPGWGPKLALFAYLAHRYIFFASVKNSEHSLFFFCRNMRLCLLFISFEYTQEIGIPFPLRTSFHVVWIELTIPHPHAHRRGNTTQASPIQPSHSSDHSHWVRHGCMSCARPIRVLPETVLLPISGKRSCSF